MIKPLLYLSLILSIAALHAHKEVACRNAVTTNKTEIADMLTCSLVNAEFSIEAKLTGDDIMPIVTKHIREMESEVIQKANEKRQKIKRVFQNI